MPSDLMRYDRWGNRLTQTVTQGSGPQPSFSFNAANQIVGYAYDAAGNVLNDGIHTYSYDAENNLTAIDGGSTASYAYDALNERVRVSTAAGTELYDFDLNGPPRHHLGRGLSHLCGAVLRRSQPRYRVRYLHMSARFALV